ncbi:hypothetical protein NN561_001037 [Cricetulus griseus]
MVAEERALVEPLPGPHGGRGARVTCRPRAGEGSSVLGSCAQSAVGHNLRGDCSPEWAALAVSFPGVMALRLRANSDVALMMNVNVVKLCP